MRNERRTARSARRHVRRVGVVAISLVVLTGGCSARDAGPGGGAGSPSPSSVAPLDLSDADLWLSFDDETVGYDGVPEFLDASGGPFKGRVVTSNEGSVDSVQGVEGRGLAAAFPPKCVTEVNCRRAMVEVEPDPSLDPGVAAFAYGATVWLSADQAADGSNIVQQGRFGSPGGQWKLQVDGADARPSCVIRTDAETHVVRSTVSVADSSWHQVVCRREAAGLSIEVDGTVDRADGPTGSLTNGEPIRIGSPGVADQDDQFHGRLDDVFLLIDQTG